MGVKHSVQSAPFNTRNAVVSSNDIACKLEQSALTDGSKLPLAQVLPGEIIDSIYSYLDNSPSDRQSLHTCTLVCHSWLPFARHRLFRGVVCRPGVPSRTLEDLTRFLCASREVVAPCVRSLRIEGGIPDLHAAVALEELEQTLVALPSLRSLSLERVTLSAKAEDESSALGNCGRPPCSALQIEVINLCDIIPGESTSVFFRTLKHWCRAPLQVSLACAQKHDLVSFQAFLDVFAPNVGSLSVNVLGGVCKIGFVADSIGDILQPSTFLDIGACTSLRELSFIFTASSALHATDQLVLYFMIFTAIMLVAETARSGLERVEMRIQRYGPHSRTTMRVLDSNIQAGGWFHQEYCHKLERGLLALRRLREFTCVLCDGGFLRQYGAYLPRAECNLPGPSGCDGEEEERGGQVEFDDYVDFFTKAYPRLHTMGIMRCVRWEDVSVVASGRI